MPGPLEVSIDDVLVTTTLDKREPQMKAVTWRLAAGVSSLITMTADLLGCVANRDDLLAEALRHGLDNVAVAAAIHHATQQERR